MLASEKACSGCHACYSVCPKQCISMIKDKLGFLYPVIDEAKCVHCNMCEKVCPVLNKAAESENTPLSFGGHSINSKIRSSSSSGGAFHVFASHILDDGGIVFGAALSEDCRKVEHIMVELRDKLWLLHGSKYVQSEVGETYKQTKDKLQEKRKVLYSGTPCQIDGLNRYLELSLGKNYESLTENLLTIEVICHGTPSPRLFERYIEEKENELGSGVIGVSFRDESGGEMLIMKIITENGIVYRKNKAEDSYYRMFLSNTCLRESCYNCSSRGLKKRADITLSDFWGVKKYFPELDDGLGLSLIIIHTEKGNIFFKEVENDFSGHEVSFEKAIQGNPSFFTSYSRPRIRDKVEDDIDRFDMRKMVNRYAVSNRDRVVAFLKLIHLYEPLRKILRHDPSAL